jgi:DNA-binding NtrC family response regulator
MIMPSSDVKISILVLDDDNDDLAFISEIIEEMDVSNFQLYSHLEIFKNAIKKDACICIIDHIFPRGNGLDLLHEIKAINPDNFVIGYSGIGDDMDLALEYLNGSLERFVRKGEENAGKKLRKFISEGFIEVELRVRRARAYDFFRREKDKLCKHEQRSV